MGALSMMPMRGTFTGCCARTASGHPAAAPPKSVMNSRRLMSDPKLRRRHLSGSNEYFDRGLKPASKPVPQCTANVAVGSFATDPTRASAEQCPLCSESDQILQRSEMTLSANSDQRSAPNSEYRK